MRHDIISDVLSVLNNAEAVGKKECEVPASGLVKNILLEIQKAGYIGNFEFIDDGKSGKFHVQLIGKINKSQSVRPRFSVHKDGYEKWEKRFLPAAGFGILIISTSQGVFSQKEAVKKGLGGKLLGFVY